MTDSILISIKKLIGPCSGDESFDLDLITHINTSFSILSDLGVGPEEGFTISDQSSEWHDYISDNEKVLNKVKTYVYLKARLYFDPPTTSFLLEAMKEQVSELEWRLDVNTDKGSEV